MNHFARQKKLVTHGTKKVTLSGLLNSRDGEAAIRHIIITTNYKETHIIF
ncbi:unnamed protein product [Arabidopsis lyrata]|uniref:Predicted protein n=1 Tax=Arabidopsis lyrata subsp. lyrata TaxID=81972 RepID=D7LMK3_ARALL|nr:predicted protein [Arabidopsis lyrata subsp. lyrata]CAH8267415.1 unnamed protein product [Arabidopsis lyrata]